MTRVWSPLLVVVVAAVVAAVVLTGSDEEHRSPPAFAQPVVTADDQLGEVVFRSAQPNATAPRTDRYWNPGHHCEPAEHPDTGKALGKYTAWTGTWIMGDGRTVMHAFMRTTGPTAPYPKSCDGSVVVGSVTPSASFARARSTQIVRSTTDGGRTWRPVHAGDVIGTHPIPFTPQPTIALRADSGAGVREGTLLRRVNGADLQGVTAYGGRPATAFLQRLAPGEERWVDVPTKFGNGVILDPRKHTYQLSRIRRLSDGRLIGLGSVGPPASTNLSRYRGLLLSSTDEGTTWRSALTVPDDALRPLEWDVAEIPGGDGDLLAVMRTLRDGEQIRAQARLARGADGTTTTTGTPNDDDGWIMEQPMQAPEQLPHSGHPELLTARVDGAGDASVIVDLATTGVHYTVDAGRSWRPLPFASGTHTTGYYPRSVQAADGTIFVFGHRGADDPYRPDLNQSIVMDRFRIRAAPAPGSSMTP